ncbi:MAG: ATP-binding protein [Bacteroidota bacterium]
MDISLFTYKNDSLIFWTDNSIPAGGVYNKIIFDCEFAQIGPGWYEIMKVKTGAFTHVAAIMVKHEYHYQNDYLSNVFNAELHVPVSATIDTIKNGNDIFSGNGKYMFSLQLKQGCNLNENESLVCFALFLAAFVFLIIFLYTTHKNIIWPRYKPNVFIFVFSIEILLLRAVSFVFHFPESLYHLKLFSPFYFAASELLPSFGDLIFNTVVFLAISVAFFRNYHIPSGAARMPRLPRNTAAFVLITFLFAFFCYQTTLIQSIILDSTISYNLNNIFNLDHYSVAGFIVIALLLFAYCLIGLKLISFIYALLPSRRQFLPVYITSGVIFAALILIFRMPLLAEIAVFMAFLGVTRAYRQKTFFTFRLSEVVFLLLLFSFISSYTLYFSNRFKEHEKRKSLAQKLTSGQDPIAEYLFEGIESKIRSDETLARSLRNYPQNDHEIKDYLLKNYFVGYWDKYKVQFTICNPADSLLIEPNYEKTSCASYFGDLIKNIGKPAGKGSLYLLNYGTGGNNYIAAIDFARDSATSTKLYIELNSKFIPKGLGYPELLIDKKIFLNTDLSSYSYAKYRNTELIDAYGKYYYSMHQETSDSIGGEFRFYHKNGYNHLVSQYDRSTTLIISKKSGNIFDLAAPFSILFSFFTIVLLLFYFIINYPPKLNNVHLNFKNRLQFSIISIVFVSFIIIGISTVLFIRNLNENKNTDIISEKAMSIMIELQNKVSDIDTMNPEQESYLSSLLVKFSNVFFTDINLYDTHGNLISTSRPQIFTEGLVSMRMNPLAYGEMTYNSKTLYVHKENIGSLEYYSAYVPFYNNKAQLIAYLNLPYFAKEGELKKELTLFLMAFINIYVFLIAISVIIALLVASRITRPLALIRDKISHVKLGRKNEKIDWLRKDEIGNLINEYNRMIDELAQSAELLARSERESAWREMAKQVAHEIKNPLTPMKLSIQHLERAWKDGVPDWGQRLERFTKTVVAQIDNLSAIATEFSDFAKMPRPENGKVDLYKIIGDVAGLYGDLSNIRITIMPENHQPFYIMADEKQILRVMNNLVKNSVQAIGKDEGGLIAISIVKQDDNYSVSITDNGCGIPSDMTSKIFTPNFSTKTEGMGLGLAMVKSIIENSGGSIRFESEESRGTTFTFSLPVYKD